MAQTLASRLIEAARSRPAEPFLRSAVPGGRLVTTYGEFADRVEHLARGLRGLGVAAGDRVGLISENRPEWLAADLATLLAGAADVPRGTGFHPAEVAAVVRHAGCRAAWVEDPPALERFREALDGLDPVILLHGEAPPGSGARTLAEVEALGADVSIALPEIAPDDVATLVYTSGTTGAPKGVTLTHGNVLSNVENLREVLPVRPGHVFLSLLPSWHMYERVVEYFVADRGGVLSYTDLRNLRADLVAERPHFFCSVPRVWERLHDAVQAGLRAGPAPARAAARAALRGSLAHMAARRARRGLTAGTAGAPASTVTVLPGLLAWPLHLLASWLVHGKLRAAVGGRMVAAISGGGALPPHVDAFLDAAGVPVLVGYGLTETSPVVAVRRPGRNVLGTIGTALRRTELRIVGPGSAGPALPGAAGVLHVRGPQVMRGYWNDEAATRAVLDPDGWLDTGDLCRMTPGGDLVFVGRAKDTIVLSGGENVEPELVEQSLLSSPLVEQVVVVGQDRKALGALVWVDPRRAAELLGPGADVQAAVKAELAARSGPAAGLRPWERVQCVALLPEALSVESGTLTATLKTRRAVVADRYAALVESLYSRKAPR